MGRWWRRTVATAIVGAATLGMTALPGTGGIAGADTIGSYSAGTKVMSIDPVTAEISWVPIDSRYAGTVSISTSERSDGTYINVAIRGRGAIDCTLVGSLVVTPTEFISRDAFVDLTSAGDGDASVGPFPDGTVKFAGLCDHNFDGKKLVTPDAPGVYETQGYLTNPDYVDIQIGGASVGTTPAPAKPEQSSPIPEAIVQDGAPTIDDCRNLPDNLERDLTPEGFAPWDWAEYVGNPFTAALIASFRMICGGLEGVTGDQEAADQLYCEAFVGAVWMLGGSATNKLIANRVPGNSRLDGDDIDNVLDVIDPSGQVQRVVEATGLKSVIGSDACRRTEGYPSVR